MTYLVYFCTCLCLVIVQTSIMPFIPLFDRFYDLMCLFVIYLGLFRPLRESLPVILFYGLFMDNLSGGPFGLYLTTYLWLFICIRWLITFLQLHSFMLLTLVVAIGVLLENLIFIGIIAVLKSGSGIPADAVRVIGGQVLWAVFTGPPLLFLFQHIQEKWMRRPSERMVK
jgi:hypothetical protein